MRPRGERGTWAGGAGAGASGRLGRGRVPGEARTGRAWAGEAGAPRDGCPPGVCGSSRGLGQDPDEPGRSPQEGTRARVPVPSSGHVVFGGS